MQFPHSHIRGFPVGRDMPCNLQRFRIEFTPVGPHEGRQSVLYQPSRDFLAKSLRDEAVA